MKKIVQLALAVLVIASTWNCNTTITDNNRPHDPWVFRSVMDGEPRMITFALHDDLWVSYSAEMGALNKAWKGGVNFDGAVYTTVHGPQPSSLGDFWLINEHKTPWSLTINGEKKPVKVAYRGHKFEGSHAKIMYDVLYDGDQHIHITEQPEYREGTDGQVGFERVFETAEVPDGAVLKLTINTSSIVVENNITTNGEWAITDTKSREYKDIKGIDVKGELTLNNNTTTNFTTYFAKRPLIENPNKIKDAAEEELPAGYKLIARSDCKACHNARQRTIGPSYIEIARRYQTNETNVALLVSKIKNGGAGNWGDAAMSPHPYDSDEDLREMVNYILAMDAEEEQQFQAADLSGKDAKEGENIDAKDLGGGAFVRFVTMEKSPKKLDEIDFSNPIYAGPIEQVGVEPNFFRENVGIVENFALEATGYLNIPVDNNIVFRLIADDGARMSLNGEVIIDHDGIHEMSPVDGEIALKAGLHPFKIEYFQATGDFGMYLLWKKYGDEDFTPVPSAIYTYKKSDLVGDAQAVARSIPGDKVQLQEVHPSYTLAQARPDDFTPKVGGLDFRANGDLVVSTWDPAGSVYLVKNAQSGDPSQMATKLIANGLAEPLGLKVVGDRTFVLQKQELTELIDHDGDEVIDEYKTLCNGWRVSGNFHEFAFGLAEKDNHLYLTLATAIEPGGASTNPQIPDRGKVVKVNIDNGDFEFVAHGLRTPNGIGIGVDNEIFVADNQGDWLPASKIVHIQKDAWYGSRSVDFDGTADLTETKPVVWLPQDEIGNSPSTPLYLNDGPYKGQMIHGEVTHGGVKRVFVEKVNGAYQGAVFRFIQGLEAGVNRLAWGPDGALYVGGVGSTGNWGHIGKEYFGLQKLTYNGNTAFEMLAVRAKSNGVEIEFTEPIEKGRGYLPGTFNVKQWYYLPTADYGGPKLDEKFLTIKKINISDDRKKVFLELDGMKENHLVYIRIMDHFLSENGNELWSTEAWYTMNSIPQNDNGFVSTTPPPPPPPNTLTDEEVAAGWKLLFDGKTTTGWRNFKKETIGKSWVIEDGALMLNSVKKDDGGWQAADGGDIITADEYENYELSLEWKIAECGNSGIIYNVVEDDKYDYVWQTGPEMQVLDNSCHPDAAIVTHRAGDLYDMIASKFVTVKPAGEWNHARLIINNGKAEHWLNGHKLVEFEMFTPTWETMIANSKFKEMPDFGKARKGHIALQDHGDKVWYRNIKIRVLDKEM